MSSVSRSGSGPLTVGVMGGLNVVNVNSTINYSKCSMQFGEKLRISGTVKSAQLTQNGHHFIILDDLQWSRHHKTEAVHTFTRVVDQVAGGTVDGLKLHGQRSETPIAGQPESRMFFKNLPVEMNTNICSHVLRTNLQHLEEERKELQTKGGLNDNTALYFSWSYFSLLTWSYEVIRESWLHDYIL